MISRMRRSIKRGGRPPKKSAVASTKQLNLHAMTTSELRALAQELGVNVAPSMKSAQIIKKIEDAQSKPSAVEKLALPTYGVPPPPPPPRAMSTQHMADSGVAPVIGKDGNLCMGLGEVDCTSSPVLKKTCQWVKEHKGRGDNMQPARCQKKGASHVFSEKGRKSLSEIEELEKKALENAKEQYRQDKRQSAESDDSSQSSQSSDAAIPKRSSKKVSSKKAPAAKAASKKGPRAAVKPARPTSCGLNAKKSHCVAGVLPDDVEHCAVNAATNRCNKVKVSK